MLLLVRIDIMYLCFIGELVDLLLLMLLQEGELLKLLSGLVLLCVLVCLAVLH